MSNLLDINGLNIEFPTRRGIIRAASNVCLHVNAGHCAVNFKWTKVCQVGGLSACWVENMLLWIDGGQEH